METTIIMGYVGVCRVIGVILGLCRNNEKKMEATMIMGYIGDYRVYPQCIHMGVMQG